MYQTFMNAYTLVDSQTRRKLDEMLKTWKEPVPGSLDTRPVFPPETTRGIESALIKARTAALQQQQARSQQDILGRGRVGTPPGWTNSPTPSQNMARYPSSANSTPPMPYQRNGTGHGHQPVGAQENSHVAGSRSISNTTNRRTRAQRRLLSLNNIKLSTSRP